MLSTDFAHPGFNLQLGEITSRGIDVWGQFAVTRNLQVDASYSYVDQKVTAGGVDFGPPLGARPSDIPVDQAALWADYEFKGLGADGLGAALGARYTGRSFGDDDNTFKVPAHTVIDAVLHYEFGRDLGALSGVRLALNVTNLFDDTYVAGCGGLDYCAYGFRRDGARNNHQEVLIAMKARAIKRWSLVHTWSSLICTLFLLVLCVTGLR